MDLLDVLRNVLCYTWNHTQQWCPSVLKRPAVHWPTSLLQGQKLKHSRSARTRFSASYEVILHGNFITFLPTGKWNVFCAELSISVQHSNNREGWVNLMMPTSITRAPKATSETIKYVEVKKIHQNLTRCWAPEAPPRALRCVHALFQL